MPLSTICRAKEHDEAFDLIGSPLSPVRVDSVCDWVEENVELPTGAITGKINLDKTPYMRAILERYGDKSCRHLVLCFGTQLGKTSILSCGMLYRIAMDPEDGMWVMANADQARDFNKERFMPFVRRCPPVFDLVPKTTKGVVDKHLWGFQNQHYRSMVLNFVGAGSPANLSSRPRGLMCMDECDKYYDVIKFDAGTIQLAEERQKTFHFPISIKASSPTLVDRMIWQEYLQTDQEELWLPCPRCEKDILLKFKTKSDRHGLCGVRWWHEDEKEAMTDGEWDLKKARANAFYKCQECGGMIHDFEREDMLQVGEWRPSNHRSESGRIGYHLSSLYSILSQETSLGAIAVKFLVAKGLRSQLQNFVNGWLAEPWDESQAYDFEEVPLEAITDLTIPQNDEDTVTLMAVDVQVRGYWVLIRRFQRPSSKYPNGQSWLLTADFVDTDNDIVELQKEYGVDGKNVTLDMAKNPTKVAKRIVEHDWRGIWGSDTKLFDHPGPGGTKVKREFSDTKWWDPMLGSRWESRTLKRCAYVLFNKSRFSDHVSALRYAKPTIWHTTVNVHPKYSRHMNSRVKRQQKNKKTGRVEWAWVELHQDNHLLDCENHVTVRAMQLGFLNLPDDTDKQHVA
jgi:DNA-directed RNA polymerase subunit RPC12/RpoP